MGAEGEWSASRYAALERWVLPMTVHTLVLCPKRQNCYLFYRYVSYLFHLCLTNSNLCSLTFSTSFSVISAHINH